MIRLSRDDKKSESRKATVDFSSFPGAKELDYLSPDTKIIV